MPTVDVGGTTLHYQIFGAGETVVLIHGLGSSGEDWAFQIPALAPHFRVIVPDLRGAGKSAKPRGPYSIDGFADDLWRMLDYIGVIDARLVGFSLGGAVAVAMAVQRPDCCSHLVLINAQPSYRVNSINKWLFAVGQLVMVRALGLRRTAQSLALDLFPYPHQQAMAERVVEVVSRQDKASYLHAVRALIGWCAARRLDRIAASTLMLVAENDYTSLKEKQHWAGCMNAALVVVKGSRHGTPFDSIGATNEALTCFLLHERLPGTSLSLDSPQNTPTEPPDLAPWLA